MLPVLFLSQEGDVRESFPLSDLPQAGHVSHLERLTPLFSPSLLSGVVFKHPLCKQHPTWETVLKTFPSAGHTAKH